MEVLKLLDRRNIGTKGNKTRFALFKCDYCGNEIELQLSNGKRNLSCGCVRYELASESNTIHGDSIKTAEYHQLFSTWSGMRDRCNRETNQDYKYYGGKGIKVCDDWDSYLEFKKWSLLNGYQLNQKLQIDRIDSNLDYSPTNCRWVTPKVNQRNRDLIILDEEKAIEIRVLLSKGLKCTEIAKMYGVHKDTISNINTNKTWQECQIKEE